MTKEQVNKLNSAWEQFKAANNKRLRELDPVYSRLENKLRVIKDLVNQGDETDATIKAIKAAVEDI